MLIFCCDFEVVFYFCGCQERTAPTNSAIEHEFLHVHQVIAVTDEADDNY